MPQVKINLTSNARFNSVDIDDVRVLNSPGSKTINLNPGNHTMTYEFRGQKGNKYSIKLTRGDDVVVKTSGTLGNDGLEIGYEDFTL